MLGIKDLVHLDINKKQVLKILGYNGRRKPPARIITLVDEYVESAAHFLDPSYAYVLKDVRHVSGATVYVEDGVVFQSDVLARLLENCPREKALAIAETGGRNLVAHGRGKNRAGADVGVFQIHCPKARPRCVKRYRRVRQSAAEAAQILTLGRRLCVSPPRAYRKMCQRGFWARYNPGSARWARRVSSLWGRIRDYLERHHSV